MSKYDERDETTKDMKFAAYIVLPVGIILFVLACIWTYANYLGA